MENHPDHEYQRIHLLRAIRHAQIEASELWLHYFGLGGDAGEYEVEAYLHGSFTLPPLQRDLLAHAANELIDRLPPPPRAPYSTDPAGDGEQPDGDAPQQAGASGHEGTALDWLFHPRTGTEPEADGDDSGPGSATEP
ncbi:hypothetical protein MN0502_15880 [Arthrobacter sp. MN05-02]|nr:hypothetical protein MN0502_15880 [Arthrobacter sp. MN05-02]